MDKPGRMFDLQAVAQKHGVSDETLEKFIKQARSEFGSDEMMVELHVVRAIRHAQDKIKM